jgi:hypothetical protein
MRTELEIALRSEKIHEKLENTRETQKENFDKNAKEKPNLEIGEAVWHRVYGDKNANWRMAKIIKPCGNAAYRIEDEWGREHTAHIDQLKRRFNKWATTQPGPAQQMAQIEEEPTAEEPTGTTNGTTADATHSKENGK